MIFSFFSSFLGRDLSRTAALLHGSIVDQSRQEVFYEQHHVPDSFDGRFEVLILHLFLVTDRLAQEKDQRTQQLNQALFDFTFAYFDQELRQMGIGDLSVPKHIKRMAKAFYGRSQVYQDSFNDRDNLQQALKRNLYGTEQTVQDHDLQFFADYLVLQRNALQQQNIDNMKKGIVVFEPIEKKQEKRA